MQKLEQTLSVKKNERITQDNIQIVIAVWNLQGMIPPINSIKIFMEKIINGMGSSIPDIVCVATQECQRSIGMSFLCQSKNEWENIMKSFMLGYKMVDSQTMNAMHTALFVKVQITDCFSTERRNIFKAGFCNCLGNKGAISLSVNLLGQNLQFINCHLEAHQNQTHRRNQVLLKIASQIAQSDIRTEVFICGDLNYRIEMSHEQYHNFVGERKNTEEVIKYNEMFNKDQLINQQSLKKNFLPFYIEGTITFPPTYKMAQNSNEYNKKRIPGWTDRIFYRKGRLQQKSYQCMYELYGTDHRPVLASFDISTQQNLSIFPDQFVIVKGGTSWCSLM